MTNDKMAEFQDVTSISFPRLSEFNYTTWKQDIKVLLMDRGSWEFITGKAKPLTEGASEKEIRQYEWRKQRAYMTIYQATERKFQPLISATESWEETWKILQEHFEPQSHARLASLVDEFFELHFKTDEETIGIFCKRVSEKKIEVENVGFKIPELLVCFQLIRRLPAKYENLVQVLYRLKDDEFTIHDVEKQLISEAGRIKLKMKDEYYEHSKVEGAYSSKLLKYHRTEKIKRSGAMQDQNTSEHRKEAHRLGPCKFCYKPGHNEDRCFKKNKLKESGIFYNELQPGHSSENFVVSTDCEVTEFLVDTAATSHICTVRDWFRNFRPFSPAEVLVGDKNSTSKIVGIGDVELIVPDKMGPPKSCLDILHFQNKRIDGDYQIQIRGKMVTVYCNGMDTAIPQEYINLTDNNFAMIHSSALAHEFNAFEHCLNNNVAHTCDCNRQDYGYTVFLKVALNVTSLKLIIDDFRFSNTYYGRPVPYGTAGDCVRNPECMQGTFSVSFKGSDFRVAAATSWVARGEKAHVRIRRAHNDQVINGNCGGYCDTCGPDSGFAFGVDVSLPS